MSADKHDLLSRVTQGTLTVARGICKNDHPDTSADVIGPNAESVADFGCSPQALPNAELFTLAADHALFLRAVVLRRAKWQQHAGRVALLGDPADGDPAPIERAFPTTLDAAGCPVLTEELRAALRKAVGP